MLISAPVEAVSTLAVPTLYGEENKVVLYEVNAVYYNDELIESDVKPQVIQRAYLGKQVVM